MLTTEAKKYYAKVLLFGEYTVIDGSAAIAIPFKKYFGTWNYQGSKLSPKDGLHKLKKYLSHLYYNNEISGVDFDLFEKDLVQGLQFDSSVPTGYGLGSSGTLTAAFFDKYVEKKGQYELAELKAILAQIESCFHGESSGLDPLVSYLNVPLLIHPDQDIEILDKDRSSFTRKLRIIDTGISRATEPLVKAYKHTRSVSQEFKDATLKIANTTDELITSYILRDETLYASQFKLLSSLQLEILRMLIPKNFHELWQTGLNNDAYYMKLCGAGGGGCLLVHLQDEELSQSILKDTKSYRID